MALADIIRRIERDAATEATGIVKAAEDGAALLVREAIETASAGGEQALAVAERAAEEEARTRLAGARLRGRDRMLAEKRELIERVLRTAVERLSLLPDDEYAALLARGVARMARGDEHVAPGRLDADRLKDTLPAALAAAGSTAALGDVESSLDHGVQLEGARMRVVISPLTLVESRRGELESRANDVLFGDKGAS